MEKIFEKEFRAWMKFIYYLFVIASFYLYFHSLRSLRVEM